MDLIHPLLFEPRGGGRASKVDSNGRAKQTPAERQGKPAGALTFLHHHGSGWCIPCVRGGSYPIFAG